MTKNKLRFRNVIVKRLRLCQNQKKDKFGASFNTKEAVLNRAMPLYNQEPLTEREITRRAYELEDTKDHRDLFDYMSDGRNVVPTQRCNIDYFEVLFKKGYIEEPEPNKFRCADHTGEEMASFPKL